ncbi:MAG: ring-1,2-phenylacetyl-CoA epoxidase subunit PaaA [Parasphingorhabdus sp.]|jgi:ring-1,2-phenylacetyl-CoA epoxidase subunit PaaA
MTQEISFEDYLAGGGKLSSPANANSRYRGEIMRLMAVFVDSEMAGASGFADVINLAPGLKERMIAARMVLEKFSHAERVLKLMQEFGANTDRYINQHPWASRQPRESNLGRQRLSGDMRLNVFHYPISDWCDAVTLNTLMGAATVIQLTELKHCSYQPLADVMHGIVAVESSHARLGGSGLRILMESGFDKAAAQASVDYWSPRVAATFGNRESERQDLFKRFALRQNSNATLLDQWQTEMQELLSNIGLEFKL